MKLNKIVLIAPYCYHYYIQDVLQKKNETASIKYAIDLEKMMS